MTARLTPVLALAVLAGGCWKFIRPEPTSVHRVDLALGAAALPGWESLGTPALPGSGELVLRPGSLLVRRVDAGDYPVALHIQVSPRGPNSGLCVVTRSSADSSGPLGLPRSGVAFIVWDDLLLDNTPYNVAVVWLDGGLLIPLDRSRVNPLPDPATIDIFDDGRWVSLAIDGEILCSTVTPDQPRRETSILPDPVTAPFRRTAEVLDGMTAQRRASGTDVLIGTPITEARADTEAGLSLVTLLTSVPPKGEDEQRRWEATVAEARLRFVRPVQGRIEDSRDDPVGGAVVLPGSQRWMFTDLEGWFLDTEAAPRSAEAWSFTVTHPDYPLTVFRVTDPEQMSDLRFTLPIEGDGDLTVTLQRPDGDRMPIRRAQLTPTGEGRPRAVLVPPPLGPLLFRNLPEGEWTLDVLFEDPGCPPFRSAPFTTAGQPGESRAISLPGERP